MAPGVPGIYAFTEGTQTYVGKSVDMRRRLLQHMRSNKLKPGAEIRVLQRETIEHLDVVEQSFIEGCGGPANMSNKINAISATRRDQLRELLDFLTTTAL
jgi:hypothetical protein